MASLEDEEELLAECIEKVGGVMGRNIPVMFSRTTHGRRTGIPDYPVA